MIDMFDKLAEPFDPNLISWRVGSTNINKATGKPYKEGDDPQGIALAYIDARDVMRRLDMVCGPENWQDRYPHAGQKTVCEIGIKVDGEWVWKSDGAGDTDVEAEKGAISDAFKRAAVKWGIGRYLYSLPSPWVKLEAKGRSWIIKKDQYEKLHKLLADYTGVSRKSSAQSKKDKDYEWFKERIAATTDLEELGGIGREIKEALPSLPVAFRDPLRDEYELKRNALIEAQMEKA